MWRARRDNADALDLIEETVKLGASPAGAKKWWLGELSREANAKGISLEELPINAQEVADVEKLIAEGKLNDQARQADGRTRAQGRGHPCRDRGEARFQGRLRRWHAADGRR